MGFYGSEIPSYLRGSVEGWGLMGTWGDFEGSSNLSLRNLLVFRKLCVVGDPEDPSIITSLIWRILRSSKSILARRNPSCSLISPGMPKYTSTPSVGLGVGVAARPGIGGPA